MKKILPIFLMGILVLSGVGAVAYPFDEIKTNAHWVENKVRTSSLGGDELDQYVIEMNWPLAPVGRFPLAPNINYILAQSFTPTKEVLTRVEILLARNDTTSHPIGMAIRDDLTGNDLATTSVDANEVLIGNFSWIEFDFSDIQVTTGQTYYIVCYTANVTDNWYLWGSNISNPYANGSTFYSTDEQQTWDEEPDMDLCFKTYGREGLDLEVSLKGGIGINLVVTNNGGEDAEDIDYAITVTGGILGMVNISIEDTIDVIEAGQEKTVGTGLFLGLGPIAVTATADIHEFTENGFVLLFFVLI
jgi:hypothetical protein